MEPKLAHAQNRRGNPSPSMLNSYVQASLLEFWVATHAPRVTTHTPRGKPPARSEGDHPHAPRGPPARPEANHPHAPRGTTRTPRGGPPARPEGDHPHAPRGTIRTSRGVPPARPELRTKVLGGKPPWKPLFKVTAGNPSRKCMPNQAPLMWARPYRLYRPNRFYRLRGSIVCIGRIGSIACNNIGLIVSGRACLSTFNIWVYHLETFAERDVQAILFLPITCTINA